MRHYRNICNELNKQISKHKFDTLVAKFANPETKTSKQQWDDIKKVTGQKHHSPPSRIIDKGNIITSPRRIANIMNQEYTQIVKDTIDNIPKTNIDPIENFRKAIGNVENKLNFKQIAMHDTLLWFQGVPS